MTQAGLTVFPIWLDHAKEYEDALGFADTIFPAFLFIVGLSLPLAIKSRISKGDTTKQLIYYILIRSAALLIMGFFHVNMEEYNMHGIAVTTGIVGDHHHPKFLPHLARLSRYMDKG